MLHASLRASLHASLRASLHASKRASQRARAHSVKLFEPLIPDKQEPVWDAWVKHVKYFEMMRWHEYTLQDIQALDNAVYDAQAAFDKAFGGQGLWKPKQHFASHLAVSTLRCGPTREYHCFSYEGMHQRVKRISDASNWRNVSKRIMRFWRNQFMCLMGIGSSEERTRLNNLA